MHGITDAVFSLISIQQCRKMVRSVAGTVGVDFAFFGMLTGENMVPLDLHYLEMSIMVTWAAFNSSF